MGVFVPLHLVHADGGLVSKTVVVILVLQGLFLYTPPAILLLSPLLSARPSELLIWSRSETFVVCVTGTAQVSYAFQGRPSWQQIRHPSHRNST
jgi:hypothetical protein